MKKILYAVSDTLDRFHDWMLSKYDYILVFAGCVALVAAPTSLFSLKAAFLILGFALLIAFCVFSLKYGDITVPVKEDKKDE